MRSVAARALGLGAITGLRSTAGPAALSRAASNGHVGSLQDTAFAVLGSSKVSTLLTLFEVGELIGDKLPVIPSRTSPLPLLGRATSGALTGAALFASEGRRTVTGGVLGALGAVASAYAGELLRMQIVQRAGLPDLVVALLEDGVVIVGAHRLLR